MGQPSEGLPIKNKKWSVRSETTPGQKNVAHPALLAKSKISLPPLNIKLGLLNRFLKAMDKDSEGFSHLRQKFPKRSEAKMKEGIFVGPQIKQLFEDRDFSKKLNVTE
jgi:hypothetical protein